MRILTSECDTKTFHTFCTMCESCYAAYRNLTFPSSVNELIQNELTRLLKKENYALLETVFIGFQMAGHPNHVFTCYSNGASWTESLGIVR